MSIAERLSAVVRQNTPDSVLNTTKSRHFYLLLVSLA